MLSLDIYCIIENYVCTSYLCFQQGKLRFYNKVFENTTLNDILGIDISELLMNIIPCHVFVNNIKSTVILSCRRKLVDKYLSNIFVIHEKN